MALNKRYPTLLGFVVVGLLCLGFVSPALALPVLSFDPAGGGSATHLNDSIGWEFNALSSITVTALGWWDETGTGIPLAHMVGIWDPGGTLLASVLVPAGTTASLDGQFRTVSISPITLAAGDGYVVGGQEFSNDTERLACGSGGLCDGSLSIVTDSRIQFVNATFSNLGGFQDPTFHSVVHDGFFGPSFSVAGATTVSEPSALILVSVGLVGVAGLGWRRRHSR